MKTTALTILAIVIGLTITLSTASHTKRSTRAGSAFVLGPVNPPVCTLTINSSIASSNRSLQKQDTIHVMAEETPTELQS